MMPPIDKDVQKQAIKEALQEWLTQKFSEFGWWTIKGLFAAGLAGLVYLALIGNGWHK